MNIHIDMFWVFLFGMFVVCVIFSPHKGQFVDLGLSP
jgi:cbb3-type cytochrome oxidase subunit 3